MRRGALRALVLAATATAGCSSWSRTPSSLAIRLDTSGSPAALVEVTGLSRRDLAVMSALSLTDDEWSAVLRVAVRGSGEPSDPARPAVAGQYTIDGSIRFVPSFPLDPGREYEVTFDPARLTRAHLSRIPPVRALVSLPAVERTASTIVSQVYPSSASIPANQLRMYVHFSGPMGQEGGLDHIALLDGAGREIVDAMLPLDTQLWNADRTRYTVLLDPGRVKRQILPNRRMGRPLRKGERITLVVRASWPDARGVPLASEFRRDYTVGPAEEHALATSAWSISPPAAGTRDPLRVTFPAPLDRGLLERSLHVSREGGMVAGTPAIADGEGAWTFTPRDGWQAGPHAIEIAPILEDRAGNRIGRAFEVISRGPDADPENSKPLVLPFTLAGAR